MFKIVQVETTNYCNAHCQFCPHDKYTSFSNMTDELYQKIVLDAAQYPLIRFVPMLNGEPFTDPKIIERIIYAREKLRYTTEIRLFTNASLISKKPIISQLTLKHGPKSLHLHHKNR